MSGDEENPPATDSAASTPARKNTSASTARRSPSRTLQENVHTNVLGRDAGDSTREIDFATTDDDNNNSNSNNNNGDGGGTDAEANKKDDGWWGSGLFGGSNQDSTNDNNVSNVNRKRRKNNARYNGLQQSTMLEDDAQYDPPPIPSTVADSSCSVGTDSLATTSVATAVTREDRIREECSYFYRGPEDDPSSPYHNTRSHRGTGRTRAAADSLLHRMSVRARLSGQIDGALFMSRYDRLNQVIDRRRRRSSSRHVRGQQYTGNDNSSGNHDNEDNNHDLFLEEDDAPPSSYREHIPSPTNNVIMGATSLANPHGVRSSMFFEQDGKMLMRLPCDQVRLVMDYNIEPGILSVEQWRSREDAQAASEKLAKKNACTRMSMQRERERRYRQREKERRRRRRRRKQREQQQPEGPKKMNNNKVKKEGGDTASAEDPLESQGGGQLPTEAIPLEEEKSQSRDIEDPHKNDDDNDNDDDDDSYSSYSYDDDSYLDDDLDDYPEDLLPDLKYVITIPDDIYRRMVGEMSAKAFPPYWGFFKCCNHESEHASIKLALVILSVVMTLLFIGSLEWRTT